MNILVTGHRGYIGSALVEILCVTSLVKNVVGYDSLDGNDILDYDNLIKFMNNIDIVIHLAALSTVSGCNYNPDIAEKKNGKGTKNFVDAMKVCGCKNIIYASTSSIYGNSEILPYTEDMTPSPCSSYGKSKLLGEEIIKAFEGNYIIFRMFNVVGNIKNLNMVSKAGYDRLFGALQSGTVTVYGKDYSTIDGTCERDYVSLMDTCQAYILGIEAICKGLRATINICSGSLISVDAIIFMWNNISKDKILHSYGGRRLGDPTRVYGSNKWAKEIIQWSPKNIMQDIISDLINFKKL